MEARQIPEGYMKDAVGRLVPTEMVREVDLLRDQVVREIVSKAQALSALLAQTKTTWFADIAAFVELSAEKYGVVWGGAKGNVNLVSFDGSLKVVLSRDEYLTFDERLQVAKELVDECLRKWSEGARPEIRTLVADAFQVDKLGRINARRILGLRKLAIEDPTWEQAMKAIGESLTVSGSRAYVRVYRRTGPDAWEQIPLDLAGV